MTDQNQSGEIFCGSCGHRLASTERFCTECGAPRPDASGHHLPQENVFVQAQEELARRKPAWIKVTLIASLVVVLLASTFGGYWYFFQRYDYTATTIKALVLGSDARAERFVKANCGGLEQEIGAQMLPIIPAKLAIELDYTEALDESSRGGEVRSALENWGSEALQSKLGGRFLKLENPESLAINYYQSASTACGLNGDLDELFGAVKELDDQIFNINNPPSNWEGYSFTRSSTDPNIAWDWMPHGSVSCSSYGEGCWGIYVKVNRNCPGTVTLKLDMKYSSYGSVVDSGYASIDYARKGNLYRLVINTYDDWVQTGSIDYVSCG